MRKTVASQVRRFRPGLDYTVAARGALSESHEAAFSWQIHSSVALWLTDCWMLWKADLDAILCFAMGGSEAEMSLTLKASLKWKI